MSYDENRISDQIDGGLINQKELIDDLLGKLQLLPEPYKTRAINNTIIDKIDLNGYIFCEKSIPDALLFAFEWEDSPEGHDFWDDYHNTLEYLTNID